MTVAVGLLTCGREHLTRRTVETFLAHNDPSRFILLHADDASPTLENQRIAQAGFDTVYTCATRQGQMAALWALVRAAERRGAEWYLHLENDQEWVAEFPWHALTYGPECVRLFGERKARSGPRAMAGKFLMGTKDPIIWHPLGDGLERGEAHWPAQTCATRMHVMTGLCDGASSVKQMMLAGSLDTVRVTENVTWHIGDSEQTPGFMP